MRCPLGRRQLRLRAEGTAGPVKAGCAAGPSPRVRRHPSPPAAPVPPWPSLKSARPCRSGGPAREAHWMPVSVGRSPREDAGRGARRLRDAQIVPCSRAAARAHARTSALTCVPCATGDPVATFRRFTTAVAICLPTCGESGNQGSRVAGVAASTRRHETASTHHRCCSGSAAVSCAAPLRRLILERRTACSTAPVPLSKPTDAGKQRGPDAHAGCAPGCTPWPRWTRSPPPARVTCGERSASWRAGWMGPCTAVQAGASQLGVELGRPSLQGGWLGRDRVSAGPGRAQLGGRHQIGSCAAGSAASTRLADGHGGEIVGGYAEGHAAAVRLRDDRGAADDVHQGGCSARAAGAGGVEG